MSGDGQGCEEDGQNRPDAGSAHVQRGQPGDQQGDFVAQRGRGFACGLDDADRELVDDLQQQSREVDDYIGAEHALGEALGCSGEGCGFSANHAREEVQAEEQQHDEHGDADDQVVDAHVLAAGDVDQRG